MSTLTFDTLEAARTLRNAGVDEQTAEAIVAVMQRTAVLPNVEHLATREQVEALDKRLSGRLDALQTLVFASMGFNLAGFLGIAAFLYAVLKHA